MTLELRGRTALVTGAGNGIGRAAAQRLLDAGASVVAVDVDQAALSRLSPGADGGALKTIARDLLEGGAPQEVVSQAISELGRVDILVNSAGCNWDAPIEDTSDDHWESLLDILVTTPFRLARALAPHFKALADQEDAAGGALAYRKVVSVAALEGVTGRPGAANYSAANAALIGFSNSLSKEWVRFRVAANAVTFGPVQTRLLMPSGGSNRLEVGGYAIQGGVPQAAAQRLGLKMEAKDSYTEDEIYDVRGTIAGVAPTSVAQAADVILFYCSPASDQISGTMHAVGSARRY